jgi:hypothetical protein
MPDDLDPKYWGAPPTRWQLFTARLWWVLRPFSRTRTPETNQRGTTMWIEIHHSASERDLAEHMMAGVNAELGPYTEDIDVRYCQHTDAPTMEDEDIESTLKGILIELGVDVSGYPDLVAAVQASVDALEKVGVTSSAFWDLLRGVATMEPR